MSDPDIRDHPSLQALLPDLPADRWGPLSGFPWIDRLPETGWTAITYWEARPLGVWPHQIAAHYDGDRAFGLATNIHGDVAVHAFPTREERDAATRLLAEHWASRTNGSPAQPRRNPDT
ncbi:hypothetical protein [Streptomyces hygroscopicus]|uniref:hypothetical protein n=1 Tax=Streptomyces hygroscopicus TaxID=1912 RepID=UPI0007815135|nr:hypothetical protein [Streptomyces hygroscopicus]